MKAFARRAALAALTLAGLGGALAAPTAAAPHAGDAAPAFSLARARGGSVSSASLRGKATYLNFFASWCGPCNEEAASVTSLYRKYRTKGLTVVGIDEQEDKDKALGFARKYGWPFPIALDGGDAIKSFGGFGLPVHVFIDRRGTISTLRIGEMSAGEIEDAIKKVVVLTRR